MEIGAQPTLCDWAARAERYVVSWQALGKPLAMFAHTVIAPLFVSCAIKADLSRLLLKRRAKSRITSAHESNVQSMTFVLCADPLALI